MKLTAQRARALAANAAVCACTALAAGIAAGPDLPGYPLARPAAVVACIGGGFVLCLLWRYLDRVVRIERLADAIMRQANERGANVHPMLRHRRRPLHRD